MTRTDLKEVIQRVLERLQEGAEENHPSPACIFGDTEPCDVIVPMYMVQEEVDPKK